MRLTDSQRALVEQNLGLALSLARAFTHRAHRSQTADLYSVARLGLVDAARTFDPGRGVRFGTHAWYRIRCALLTELGRLAREPAREALDPRSEELADPAPPVDYDLEVGDDFEALIASLPDRHRLVCRRYYRDGRRLKRIATEIGLSVTRVQQIHQEALKCLEERLSRARSATSSTGSPT